MSLHPKNQVHSHAFFHNRTECKLFLYSSIFLSDNHMSGVHHLRNILFLTINEHFNNEFDKMHKNDLARLNRGKQTCPLRKRQYHKDGNTVLF